MRAGRPVGNSQCTVDVAESRVIVAGDRVTVEFAVRFAAGWKGSKLVYAYANSFGDTRNTGWKEVGSWLVREERTGEDSAPSRSRLNEDPNDNPTKELDRAVTDYRKFLQAKSGGDGTDARQNGRKTAMAGAVTHQDGTGKWVANTPVISETKQGWRLDGTSNRLIIRKKGLSQHEITQTYTDYVISPFRPGPTSLL